MKEIEIQASCTKETSVTHEMLASSVGSGSVDVYAMSAAVWCRYMPHR